MKMSMRFLKIVCLSILLLNTIVPLASVVALKTVVASAVERKARLFGKRLANYDYRWNLGNVEKWRPYAKADEDSAELIIGINKGLNNAVGKLRKLVTHSRCRIVNLIEIGNRPIAAVVDVPIEKLQTFAGEVEMAGIPTYIEPNFKVELLMTPNDPLWQYQWGPKKIQADYAWDTQMGNSSLIVSVVDTGVHYTHEDLVDNYISGGYDWVNEDEDPFDDYGHGTHCAGIIAAKINNYKGVAGLAQVKIMAEKVLSSSGWGYYDWVASGIIHATDSGADIISMSLGGYYPSKLLGDSVKYAFDSGVLVIAAAGNDNSKGKHYPAAYEEVIAVAATNQNDDKAYFSNWGEWIELSAPGVDINSTVPWGYEAWDGTSMACPHVSGVAALAWSQFPNKPVEWIREWLRYTVDDLGDPGFDIYYGYGRVNAKKAVETSPPEHDIILLDNGIPKFLRVNESATITASIMNFGSQDETNVPVQFYIDSSLQQTQNVTTLKSGSITEVSFFTSGLPKRTYNMTVFAVPIQGETRTNNNVGMIYTVVDEIIKVPEHFETVQEAVDVSRPGDTIYVASGSYDEYVCIDKDKISLFGESRNETVIEGSVWLYGNEIHLSNVSLTNGAFELYGTKDCIIEDVIASKSSGIYIGSVHIFNGENNTVRNSFVEGFLAAIVLINSTGTTISNNYIYGPYGIAVNGYGTNYILNNQIVDTLYAVTFGHGLWIPFAEGNNVFRNNTISGYYEDMDNRTGGIGFWGTKLSYFVHDIDTSNTLNGKPIYYLINESGLEINSTAFPEVGFLAIINSTNISVENLTMEDASHGVLFAYVSNSSIRNIECQRVDYGVRLISTYNVSLFDSRITTSYNYGIRLEKSSKILMRSNTVFDNVWRNFAVTGEELSNFIHDIDQSNTINGKPIYYLLNGEDITVPQNASYVGIVNSTDILVQGLDVMGNEQGILFVNTQNSRIEDVKMHDNFCGIQLIESNNNTIKGNHVQGGYKGIELRSSNNNSIHLNNFDVAFDKTETASTNIWNGWWNVSGNFWSIYTGEDNDGDGIGDTKIPYQGVDYNPLMAPHLPGDLNYDGYVNDTDINILQAAYGSSPGDANWNPHADLDEDGYISIYDAVVVTAHYNMTWSEYWKVDLVPLTVLAKDQYEKLLTTMEVWIDGQYAGYSGSTFYVAVQVDHQISVSNEYTDIVSGDGKYVYTFDYWYIHCTKDTNNPVTVNIAYPTLITAYYNCTFHPELEILAEDQYGQPLTTMKVWIDGELVGYTGSVFYVELGERSIEVQNQFIIYGHYGTTTYTFNRWKDGPTANPRTIMINEAISLTAIYHKTFEPGSPGPPPKPV